MTRTLLVTVDSLRHDHFQDMDATRSYLTTEHDAAYATYPSTIGSFQSIIGGYYPTDIGLDAGTSVATHPTYSSDYSVGIITNGFTASRYGYADGFDDFFEPGVGDASLHGRIGNRLPDGVLYQLATVGWNTIQRVAKHVRTPTRSFASTTEVISQFQDAVDGEDDWFGWLHLMEPHHPYEPSNGPVDRVTAQNLTRKMIANGGGTEEEEEIVRECYRQEVIELDEMLAPLWDALDDETRVLFCADHGELLGEDDHWGHPDELHEDVLHVPVASKNIDLPSGDVMSLIDIPSILVGEDYNMGDLDRDYAFALFNEKKAVTDGETFVSNSTYGEEDRTLQRQLDTFDVDSGLSRADGLEDDLEALGYK